MEKQNNDSVEGRKRKFFLILPVFLVPFLAGFFYAFGGGNGVQPDKSAAGEKGFNTVLPTAQLKDRKDLNKMSFYEQADRDSASLREKKESDPYFGQQGESAGGADSSRKRTLEGIPSALFKKRPDLNPNASTVGSSYAAPGGNVDENAAKVYQKIAQLNEAISSAPHVSSGSSPELTQTGTYGEAGSSQKDIDRLQGMLETLKSGNAGAGDPQLQQLNGMLDKIIAIQNPPNKDSLQRLSVKNKGRAYPVFSSPADTAAITLLDGAAVSANNGHGIASSGNSPSGFLGLDDNLDVSHGTNVVTAALDETQTVVSGSDVRLRLTSDMYVDGVEIPAGTQVTGSASLSGERLRIEVTSLCYNKSIYPVNLAVYDVDGVAGVFIPGSINRDVSKESADEALNDMNLMSFDQSVGAQAASAGIQAAKTLISKKVRLIRVTIKDGYQVFLKNAGGEN